MGRHDLHTHTRWSDGSHGVREQVLCADAQELEAFAVTDHLFPGKGLSEPGELERYVAEIREASRGARTAVLAGVEATALDCSGAVSVTPEVSDRLDWVLCDLSSLSEGTLRSTPSDKGVLAGNVLRTYHALCELAWVDCIAHPFNTGRCTPFLLPEDYPAAALDELAAHMAQAGTVFDVMNLMPWWFAGTGLSGRELTSQYVELLRIFVRRGVRFQHSSDDHRSGVGNTGWSALVLERAGVEPRQVVSGVSLARRGRRS